jgi:hypothetical protein
MAIAAKDSFDWRTLPLVRAGYAGLNQLTDQHRPLGQVFVTHTDFGGTEFNYHSELVGSSLAVCISNAYYPGSRNLGGNFQKLTLQVAADAVSNVLKEFWPDVKRKLSSLHAEKQPADGAKQFGKIKR